MDAKLQSKLLRNIMQDNCKTPVPKNSNLNLKQVAESPFLQKLGYGTGVEVLRMKRSSNNTTKSPWAVKMLSRKKGHNNSKIYGDRLTEEAKILRRLDHPNIIGFRGFERLPNGNDCIAMEYCNTSLGDLLEERFDCDFGPLGVDKIKKMALDVVRALHYLHTKVLILHGDIKSFNILVKGEFEICKVCDFGVSLSLTAEGYLDSCRNYVGTGLWAAPETMMGDVTLIGTKSDIFSFGLVIFETVALVPPHTNGINDDEVVKTPDNPTRRTLNISEVITIDDDDEIEDDACNIEDKENKPQQLKDDSIISILDDSSESMFQEDSFGLTSQIGTRPPIPDYIQVQLTDEYNVILEMFYLCTNREIEDRPTAEALMKTLEK